MPSGETSPGRFQAVLVTNIKRNDELAVIPCTIERHRHVSFPCTAGLDRGREPAPTDPNCYLPDRMESLPSTPPVAEQTRAPSSPGPSSTACSDHAHGMARPRRRASSARFEAGRSALLADHSGRRRPGFSSARRRRPVEALARLRHEVAPILHAARVLDLVFSRDLATRELILLDLAGRSAGLEGEICATARCEPEHERQAEARLPAVSDVRPTSGEHQCDPADPDASRLHVVSPLLVFSGLLWRSRGPVGTGFRRDALRIAPVGAPINLSDASDPVPVHPFRAEPPASPASARASRVVRPPSAPPVPDAHGVERAFHRSERVEVAPRSLRSDGVPLAARSSSRRSQVGSRRHAARAQRSPDRAAADRIPTAAGAR